MEVTILEKNKINSSRKGYPSEFYLSPNSLESLKFISEYEYKTFLLLLKTYYPDESWLRRFNFSNFEPPSDVLKELSGMNIGNNYVLNMLGDIDFKKDAERLYKNVEEFTDVYEKDMELNNEGKYVFILSYKSRYLAHVYYEEGGGLIGIRMSLYNYLSDLHGLKDHKQIGYILLDAFVKFGRKIGMKTVNIEQPIGVMRYISKKFGFIDDSFNVNDHIKVDIPEYTLNF